MSRLRRSIIIGVGAAGIAGALVLPGVAAAEGEPEYVGPAPRAAVDSGEVIRSDGMRVSVVAYDDCTLDFSMELPLEPLDTLWTVNYQVDTQAPPQRPAVTSDEAVADNARYDLDYLEATVNLRHSRVVPVDKYGNAQTFDGVVRNADGVQTVTVSLLSGVGPLFGSGGSFSVVVRGCPKNGDPGPPTSDPSPAGSLGSLGSLGASWLRSE